MSDRTAMLGRALPIAATIAKRVVHAAAVCSFVVIVVFLLVRVIPGDPVSAITGPQGTSQTRDVIRSELGLDKPLPEQFVAYVSGIFQGDLGNSLLQRDQTVASIIGGSLPTTLALVAGSLILATLFGVPLGLISAASRGAIDTTTRITSIILLATPPFFMGLILILVFALSIPMFPAGGWAGSWPGNLKFLVLPCAALSATLLALVIRVTRQSANDALQQRWAEAAFARGLPTLRVYLRHVLPNCGPPIVTLLGFNAGVLISGAVVVEAVFGLPGIGQELVDAVGQRDYPVIQGVALVTAVVVVAITLVTDLIVFALDPRIEAS